MADCGRFCQLFREIGGSGVLEALERGPRWEGFDGRARSGAVRQAVLAVGMRGGGLIYLWDGMIPQVIRPRGSEIRDSRL